MVKYKMLVMDMDGTLLTDDKRISQRNHDAIKKAFKKGVKVVISTGRIFASAKVFGEMIGVDTPIIASNGAYIREKDKDEVIYMVPLGEENARRIVRLSKKYGIYCHLFTSDTIYSEKMNFSAINYTKWNKGLPDDKKVQIRIIEPDQWDEIISKNKDCILKSVITDEDADKVIQLRQEVSRLNVEIASSYANNFEVMNSGVSKGKAVETLANSYKIDREEIICMGDSENDISMIKYAGLGVAMENGSDDIKKVAKYITLSNENDGVAHVIEKFIL